MPSFSRVISKCSGASFILHVCFSLFFGGGGLKFFFLFIENKILENASAHFQSKVRNRIIVINNNIIYN